MSEIKQAIAVIQTLVEQLKRTPDEADFGQEADAISAAELFIKKLTTNYGCEECEYVQERWDPKMLCCKHEKMRSHESNGEKQ